MIGYALALLPLYFFIYIPVSQLLGFSSSSFLSSSSSHDDHGEHVFNESFIAFEEPGLECHEHTYTTHILSREPLVLYLEGWLGEREIRELVEISADQFAPSRVSTGPAQFINPSIRRSEVATLPRTHTVKCIEDRVRALQGWGRQSPQSQGWSLFGGSAQTRHADGHEGRDGEREAGLMLERLKIQKYDVGGHYTHHYDWQGAGKADRVSSFMVYVDANCTGGGTAFPRLPKPASGNWCRFVDCAADGEHEGVVFKPVRGNAVYWENLRADGTGYLETWHAGLPVETGTKIGLNIWTWYRF